MPLGGESISGRGREGQEGSEDTERLGEIGIDVNSIACPGMHPAACRACRPCYKQCSTITGSRPQPGSDLREALRHVPPPWHKDRPLQGPHTLGQPVRTRATLA